MKHDLSLDEIERKLEQLSKSEKGREQKQEPPVKVELTAEYVKKESSKKEPAQIARHDMDATLSGLIKMQEGLSEIRAKQNEIGSKKDLGKTGFSYEKYHLSYLNANLNTINPVCALNILYETAYKNKDGFLPEAAAEFNRIAKKIMALQADAQSLLRLDERVKTKPRKSVYIKKLNLLLGKWNGCGDKKLLDEILLTKNELENHTNDKANEAEYSALAAAIDKGKESFNQVKQFCLIKLFDIAEPPEIKEIIKPAEFTVFGLLDNIGRELVYLNYDLQTSLFSLADEIKQEIRSLKKDEKPLNAKNKTGKEPQTRSNRTSVTPPAAVVDAPVAGVSFFAAVKPAGNKSQPVASNEEKDANSANEEINAQNGRQKRAENPSEPLTDTTYNEILDEISQLKSDLEIEIKNVLGLEEK